VNDNGSVQGGADAVAIASAIGLAKAGEHVVFLAATTPVAKELAEAGVTVSCMGIYDILHDRNRLRATVNGIYNRDAARFLKKELDRYSPEDTIVHVHTWTKAFSSAAFRITQSLGFKTVLTLHDYFSVCPNGGFYNYNCQAICHLEPMSARCIASNCDSRSYAQKQWRVIRQFVQNQNIKKHRSLYLLAVSKKTADIVGRYFPNHNVSIQCLQNPIESFEDTAVQINNSGKYFFMGRLAKEKGPELFCEAITQLGLQGVVIGDGYLRNELEAKYPDIEFTGWLSGDKKLKMLRHCKCFVFSTRWYETFGLVVAEMKALGIPSIVPMESTAAEQIEDGITGLLYRSGDIVSLKETIMKFEGMNLENLHNNIKERFTLERYSLEAHVDSLLRIYASILSAEE